MNAFADRARNEYGRVKIASAILIFVLAAAGYGGVVVGGVYFRKMKFEEAIRQQLSYAGQVDDASVRQQIVNAVMEIGLPPAAQRIGLTRTGNPRALHVSVAYSETVNLLFTTMDIPIHIQLNRGF